MFHVKVKVKDQIMYFLVNAYPPKLLVNWLTLSYWHLHLYYYYSTEFHVCILIYLFLFDLILKVPVSNFSIMSGWVFLG